jgi:transposase
VNEELIKASVIDAGSINKVINDIMYYIIYEKTLKKISGNIRKQSIKIGEYSVVIEGDRAIIGPIEISGTNPYKLKGIGTIVKSDRAEQPKYAIIEISNKGYEVFLAYERQKSIIGVDFGIRNLISVIALRNLKVWKYRFWKGEEIITEVTKYIGETQGFVELEKIKKYFKNIIDEVTEYIVSLYPKVVAIEDITEFEGKKGLLLKTLQHTLEAKLYSTGIKYKRINAYGTSRLCSNCGYKNGEVYGALFTCPLCGFKADRDFNAAMNIALKCYYTC